MPYFLAFGHLGELFWLSASAWEVLSIGLPVVRRAGLLNNTELEIFMQMD